jgi:hypothetical protein
MLRRVAVERTDVSEEFSASIIRVTGIGELGTLVTTNNRRTLRRNTKYKVFLVTLRNVGSYKSHTAYHPRRRHSSVLKWVLSDGLNY